MMFPTLFDGPSTPRRAAGPQAILDTSLEVAERGEQVRSQFRGALVEELTARLLARGAAGGGQSGASGGSCSTGSGPRSIPTT